MGPGLRSCGSLIDGFHAACLGSGGLVELSSLDSGGPGRDRDGSLKDGNLSVNGYPMVFWKWAWATALLTCVLLVY